MTWPAFTSMGSHAPYVWSAYVIALLAFGFEVWSLRRRRRRRT